MASEKQGRRPAVLAVVAPSGTGKTTLLCDLLPRLRVAGLRVGVVKKSHHEIEVDRPGKDSYRLRKAGAEQALLVSRGGWALMADDSGPEPDLEEAVARFHGELDLILVEGYRTARCPKLELIRGETGEPPLFPLDRSVVAVVTDRPSAVVTDLPLLPLADGAAVAAFVERWVERDRAQLELAS